MKSQEEIRNNPRVIVRETSEDGGAGWIRLGNSYAGSAAVVWSFGAGWDHVSISFPKRCPTLGLMFKVKKDWYGKTWRCFDVNPEDEDRFPWEEAS